MNTMRELSELELDQVNGGGGMGGAGGGVGKTGAGLDALKWGPCATVSSPTIRSVNGAQLVDNTGTMQVCSWRNFLQY